MTTTLDDPLTWEVLGILGCLVLSAFFSGSETALTSLSSSKTRQLIEEDGKVWLQLWLDRPIPVLTTILIGNNIVNVASSALATDLTHRLLDGTKHEGLAIPAAVGAMTLLLLTFGEITPKAIAKRLHIQFGSVAMRMLRPMYYVFHYTGVTRVFVFFTRAIMRRIGNDVEDRSPYVTYEEIEYLIALGSKEGTFSEDKERLLRSVVEFPETLVKEIMVPRTDMIATPDSVTLDELLGLLAECGHSRIPVYAESIDDVVGIFYAKDLIPLLSDRDEADAFNMQRYLRPSFFIPETKRIADLLAEFQGNRMHIAIVVDEFGGTAGIITLEDIIEEIFGDIQDEYDAEPEQILEIGPDILRADARVPIEHIEQYFGVHFPDEVDYESLGGFILAEMGSVPTPGEEFQWKAMFFRIIDADEKKIITVEVERISEVMEDEASEGLDEAV